MDGEVLSMELERLLDVVLHQRCDGTASVT